jgi:hypothetical protein
MHFAAAAQVLLRLEISFQLLAISFQLLSGGGQRKLAWHEKAES